MIFGEIFSEKHAKNLVSFVYKILKLCIVP